MRLNAILIVSLLMIVISAPIVDAIACDDCKDISQFRDTQQRVMTGADNSDNNPLSSDAGSTAPQETSNAKDLCPVCANMAVGMGKLCCAPSMNSQVNHLPQMLALMSPSYPINKPPQN